MTWEWEMDAFWMSDRWGVWWCYVERGTENLFTRRSYARKYPEYLVKRQHQLIYYPYVNDLQSNDNSSRSFLAHFL